MITLFFDNPRIGHVLDPDSFAELRFGGIQVQMAHLIQGLLQTREYKIVIISDEPFIYPGVEIRSKAKLIQRGVPILSRWINKNRRKRVFAADTPRRVFLQSHIKDGHMTDEAIFAGVETVFRVNSDSLVDDSHPTSSAYLDLLHSYFSKFDIIICQSAYQQRLLRERWRIEAPIVTMGTKPIQLAVEKSELLWVGRCTPFKQPWLFLELARSFPEHACRMVLSIARSVDADLADALAINAKDIPNLTIERNVSYADMPERYARACAFVSTSLVEGAPNVFAEAGMAATPVFSLAVNPANMLDEGELGACADGNFGYLHNLLRDYLDETPEVRAERQSRAHEFAQSQWSVGRMVESYRRVFEHKANARKSV